MAQRRSATLSICSWRHKCQQASTEASYPKVPTLNPRRLPASPRAPQCANARGARQGCHPMPTMQWAPVRRAPGRATTFQTKAVYRFLTSRMLPCHHPSGTTDLVLPTFPGGFRKAHLGCPTDVRGIYLGLGFPYLIAPPECESPAVRIVKSSVPARYITMDGVVIIVLLYPGLQGGRESRPHLPADPQAGS